MKVIVAGTVRVPPENVEKLRPHMHTMLAASRAEDGCEVYSYGFDAQEPGLVRIFEIWRDRDALNAHARAPHMAPWRTAGAELGVSDRQLKLYEVASETALG
jgi:quinol monooxygenase YgiN